MTSSSNRQFFGSSHRVSQILCNERCQNILFKAVFEHFAQTKNIAALLLASKSFQNSSFGANFIVNFVVDDTTISLLESVLSPSSCLSLQFVPSVHIGQSEDDSQEVNRGISNFAAELVKTKYLHLSLRSLTLDKVLLEVVSLFFGDSSDAWPQLQELHLEQCLVNDDVVEIISKTAVHLRTVDLSGNWEITESGLKRISTLSEITSLNLTGGGSTTDAGLEHVSNLSDITYLNLRGCYAITDRGLRSIAKLSEITFLDLSLCDEITDVGLEHISELARITSLHLGNCRAITDAGFEHFVVKLFMITTLDLNNCNVTDVGLAIVSTICGITSLNLANCDKITDVGLEAVAKLARITSLNLKWCYKITDAGLEYISKLSSITSLDLRSCPRITDASVDHLTSLSNIIYLNLYNCHKITDEAKHMLEAALPNCNIH